MCMHISGTVHGKILVVHNFGIQIHTHQITQPPAAAAAYIAVEFRQVTS